MAGPVFPHAQKLPAVTAGLSRHGSQSMSESASEAVEAEAEEMLDATVADADPDGQAQDGPDEQGQEPQEPEVGPDGYPLNTPVSKMAPEHQAAYWRHQARKHEKAVKAFGKLTPEQVKEMTARIREIEDAQKTEQEKLAERLAEAERRATELEASRARLLAAAAHDIPPALVERLGGTTEDEINETAQLVAEEIEAEVQRRLAEMPPPSTPKPAEPEQTPARVRPVESLRPGAMPASDEPEDFNEAFRLFLGGGRR